MVHCTTLRFAIFRRVLYFRASFPSRSGTPILISVKQWRVLPLASAGARVGFLHSPSPPVKAYRDFQLSLWHVMSYFIDYTHMFLLYFLFCIDKIRVLICMYIYIYIYLLLLL